VKFTQRTATKCPDRQKIALTTHLYETWQHSVTLQHAF